MDRQRRVLTWALVSGGPSNNDAAFPLLTARAREVPRLLGYRMWFNIRDQHPTTGDQTRGVLVLQPVHERLGVVIDDFFPGEGVGAAGPTTDPHRQLIDVLSGDEEVALLTSGSLDPRMYRDTGWVPTDLLLPELGVAHRFEFTDDVQISYGVTFEWVWEPLSISEMAAVNLVWGRDANDFVG
ncbi:hypothetical protein LCGC14_1982850 [marine sediment metagenome]|uniref:Uncharacterized protein n=1 Tax=marine sediment metagenome TaxID=412755 RepID=A0A0F9I5G2_9ZZZZ